MNEQEQKHSKEQSTLRGLVVRIHKTSLQEATRAKEKSSRQKGTEWCTRNRQREKTLRSKRVFRRPKPPKSQLGIGLNEHHRKSFGLLDTQGVWCSNDHIDVQNSHQQ